MLVVVETKHGSLQTFCNDREWGGRGIDANSRRLHIQDLKLTPVCPERTTGEELRQEERTPEADMARSES